MHDVVRCSYACACIDSCADTWRFINEMVSARVCVCSNEPSYDAIKHFAHSSCKLKHPEKVRFTIGPEFLVLTHTHTRMHASTHKGGRTNTDTTQQIQKTKSLQHKNQLVWLSVSRFKIHQRSRYFHLNNNKARRILNSGGRWTILINIMKFRERL